MTIMDAAYSFNWWCEGRRGQQHNGAFEKKGGAISIDVVKESGCSAAGEVSRERVDSATVSCCGAGLGTGAKLDAIVRRRRNDDQHDSLDSLSTGRVAMGNR
jgi:transcriptional regulatory protein LevR